MKKMLFILLTIFTCALWADEQYNLELPKTPKSSKMPCIIIAPGSGYHKDRPIIVELAKQANQAGFASLRFNWSPKPQSMPDSLYPQSQYNDVIHMIELAKKTPQIDSTHIILAGKSLGSVLAYQAALNSKDIFAIVLLTPIFPAKEYVEQLYPQWDKQELPVLVIVGDHDEANTLLPVLYESASQAKAAVNIVVVGGDHSLNINAGKTGEEQKQNQANIELACKNVISWISRLLP
jgi:predicted alpha/beta-hydrolase family hydrolase